MQINFEAKKLKEANEYVDLLNPSGEKSIKKNQKIKKESLFKKIFKFLGILHR